MIPIKQRVHLSSLGSLICSIDYLLARQWNFSHLIPVYLAHPTAWELLSRWVVFGNCKNWRQTIYDGKTSANYCESWTVQGRILPVSTYFARLVFSPEIATACLALPCSSCKSANNMESREENPLVHNIWMVQKWWKFRMIDKGSCSFRHRKYLPKICYSCYFASNFSLRENLHKLSTLSGRPPSTKHHFCSHKLLWRFLMICIRNPPLRFVLDHDHRQ